jgi:hypothetical protein
MERDDLAVASDYFDILGNGITNKFQTYIKVFQNIKRIIDIFLKL